MDLHATSTTAIVNAKPGIQKTAREKTAPSVRQRTLPALAMSARVCSSLARALRYLAKFANCSLPTKPTLLTSERLMTDSISSTRA